MKKKKILAGALAATTFAASLSGWVVPMQQLIDKAGYDISQIEPNIAAYYTTEDGLYSMPFNSSAPLLYYNKDMFEAAGITEVPTSLDQIAEVGDQLKEKAGTQEVLAMSVYGWWFEQFLCKQDLYKQNMEKYPQFQTAIDQLHDTAPEYTGALLSVFPESRQIVETEIEEMLNGNQTPEEAVQAIAEQVNESIETYNLLNG